jgi:hypothetical protein
MTFAPGTIIAAAKVMTDHGFANAGIVGNAAHVAVGTSYHLGKSQLISTAYSIALARDKAGCTEAAAALDVSRGSRTLAELQAWSRWLVAQCQAKAPGTEDIREVIYSPDGVYVKRWDNYAHILYAGGTGTGQGDDSHLWHTHISWFRDTESKGKASLLLRYFPAVPDTSTEVPMPVLSRYIPGQVATIKATSNIRSAPSLTATKLRTLAAPETWVVTGFVKGGVDPTDGSDQWLIRWANGTWEYTANSNISAGPAPAPAPVDTSPFTQADIDKAVAAAQAADAAAVAAVQAQADALKAKIGAALKALS